MKKTYKFNLTRNEYGKHALNKVLCVVTALALVVGFEKEAWTRALGLWDYIGFSIGMAFTYAPVEANKALKRFSPSTPPAPDQPSAAAAQPGPGGAD